LFDTILTALREPERFTAAGAFARPSLGTLVALGGTATLGVGAYGAAMHAHDGLAAAGFGLVAAIGAAGATWCATVPSLYVLGSLNGSRLDPYGVALTTLTMVSFGGVAMLASVPVLWFFETCLPVDGARLAVHVLTFAGVGLSMMDVWVRSMRRVEGGRLLHLAFLALFALVGLEMFLVFGLFDLGGL
jgi:hypothetical protein